MKFVMESRPVLFKWKNSNSYNYGFIAQEIYKLGLKEIAVMTPDPNAQETRDPDGFVSPAGYRFNINYNQLTALLTQAIKKVFSKLGWVDHDISILKTSDVTKGQRIQKLEEQNAKLEERNAKLQTEIIALKAYLCNKDPSATFCGQ